jgi:transketolase
MDDSRRGELEKISLEVRKDVVRMAGVARSHVLATALTIVDILVYLYWEKMKIFPGERNRPERDRFVTGNSVAAPALYACLARLGFFGRDDLWSYRRLGGTLQGYPNIRTPGIDAPGGTSGLGIAFGLSVTLRMDGYNGLVYCVMGDDELKCGEVWESLAAISSYRPGNLLLVIESRERGTQFDKEPPDAAFAKLTSFGWLTASADGHDFNSIERAFSTDPRDTRPMAVIARTKTLDASYVQLDVPESERRLSPDDVERTLSRLDTEARKRGVSL